MSSLPVTGYIEASARNVGEMKTALETLRSVIAELLGGSAETELTIASGIITPTIGCHSLDTESNASTDDLTNILATNTPDGRLLLVHSEDNGRNIVVKHGFGGTGQILIKDSLDITLDLTNQYLLLKLKGSTWEEVDRFGFQATTTQRGVVELATNAETITGTDSERAITPAGLEAKVASTTAKGIVQLALSGEAVAMTDANKSLTPEGFGKLALYDEIYFDAGMMQATPANGATESSITLASNNHKLDSWRFSGSTKQYLSLKSKMPPTWDKGTFKAKFDFLPLTGCSVSDTVKFELSAVAVGTGGSIDVPTGTPQATTKTIVSGQEGVRHFSDATPAITPAGTPQTSDLMLFLAARDPANDTMDEAAELLGITVQFKRGKEVTQY